MLAWDSVARSNASTQLTFFYLRFAAMVYDQRSSVLATDTHFNAKAHLDSSTTANTIPQLLA